MAKVLKKFEFKTGGAAESSYDWDSLLNGKILMCVQGEDYQCKTATFIMLAKETAGKRHVHLAINSAKDGDKEAVVLQSGEAFTEVEATEYDEKKAAQKARWKANKEAKKANGNGDAEGETEDELPEA